MTALAARCRQCAWVDWRSRVCSRTGAVAAVEEPVVEGVQALGLVELAADRASLALVGEVAEHKSGLDQAPVFLQGAGERELGASGLQAGDQQAGGDGA